MEKSIEVKKPLTRIEDVLKGNGNMIIDSTNKLSNSIINNTINNSNFIIDTIRLRIKNPQLSKNANVLLENKTNVRTGETIDEESLYSIGGFDATGTTASYKSDKYYIFFKSNSAFVQFSLSKYIHGTHNAYCITQNELEDAIDNLEAELYADGFQFDLWDSLLSRVDLAIDIPTKYSFKSYDTIFDILRVKRSKKMKYDTSHYISSGGRWTINIYDKIKEMRSKKVNTSTLPNNLMRIEYRMMKADQCLKDFHYEKLIELHMNFNSIQHTLKSRLTSELFMHCASSFTQISTFNDELNWFHSNSSNKNWYQKFESYQAAKQILSNTKDFAVYKSMLCKHMTVQEANRKIHRHSSTMFTSGIGTSGSLVDLYTELFTHINSL